MRAFRLTVLIGVISMLLVLVPAAAQAPRVPPTNDNIGVAPAIAAPYIESLLNIDEATIQTGEPEHPCAGAASDNSIWYVVFVPAGATLVVDTSETNADTVISVWTSVIPWGFPQLTNVDCEDDGTASAKLNYLVPAGREYFVNVSTIGPSPSILTVNVDITVPASLLPQGQHPDTPIDLKLNGTTKLTGLEYGLHSFHGAGPTCNIPASDYAGWFRFTLPFRATLNLSTEGSIRNTNGEFGAGTTLTLYPTGALSQADELDCSTSGGVNSAAISTIVLQAGTYIARVSIQSNNSNLNGPSRYKLRVRTAEIPSMVINGTFELVTPLDGWTIKNGSGEGLSTPGEAISGSASFKFVGNAEEKSKLQQTTVLSAPLPVDDDMFFEFGIFAELNFDGDPYTTSVTLSYSDGSKQKIKHSRLTVAGIVAPEADFTPPGKKTLVKVKVSIKFAGENAVLLVDNIGLLMETAIPRDVLLLPPPPAQ